MNDKNVKVELTIIPEIKPCIDIRLNIGDAILLTFDKECDIEVANGVIEFLKGNFLTIKL